MKGTVPRWEQKTGFSSVGPGEGKDQGVPEAVKGQGTFLLSLPEASLQGAKAAASESREHRLMPASAL